MSEKESENKKVWWTDPSKTSIHYADTGFEIRLSNDPNKLPYSLYDPSERFILESMVLFSLKQLAEAMDKERQSFYE